MTPEQASKLRVAIHRLVRAEREYAILGCGSRSLCRHHQKEIAKLLREATVAPEAKPAEGMTFEEAMEITQEFRDNDNPF